jgi:DNA-binding CsgD family transcriptional regulator
MIVRVAGELRKGLDARAGRLKLSLLSKRELEIYALLCRGKKYKEVGDALYISENTVKTIIKIIYRKLGISNRGELMGTAAVMGETAGES